jgi:hypothetical protein
MIASCQAEISAIEKRLLAQHRKNADSKRLETIPGIGVLGASAIVATVPDASIFKTGRDFAAWIGIVWREDSTGGKQRLGPADIPPPAADEAHKTKNKTGRLLATSVPHHSRTLDLNRISLEIGPRHRGWHRQTRRQHRTVSNRANCAAV